MPQSVLERLQLLYSPLVLKSTIHIVLILVAGLVALKLIDSALKRIWSIVPPGDSARARRVAQRAETLRHIVISVGRIVLWSFASIMIIGELGFETATLLTGAGILGLAVGFGAQSLVKDVISGFFILLEDQYGIGDSVKIGEHEGMVEHMTLRTTVLRNFEGHVHVIPNGAIVGVSVLNRDWARAVVDITVPHTVEIGRLFRVLEATADRLSSQYPDNLIAKPKLLGIEKLSEEGATVRMAVKTKPSKRAEVTREWRRIVREDLDREGIELAYKHQV
jgi:small-conductance mechanosensitive channel